MEDFRRVSLQFSNDKHDISQKYNLNDENVLLRELFQAEWFFYSNNSWLSGSACSVF